METGRKVGGRKSHIGRSVGQALAASALQDGRAAELPGDPHEVSQGGPPQ
jgi:hypothetical protein